MASSASSRQHHSDETIQSVEKNYVSATVKLLSVVLFTLVALVALLSAAKAVLLFTFFTSHQNINQTAIRIHHHSHVSETSTDQTPPQGNHEIDEGRDETLHMLTIDFLLLALFIFQHSFMASRFWKSLLTSLRLTVVERALYVIATSLVLEVMTVNWKCTTSAVVWFVDTENCTILWLLFTVIHVIGWTLIFGATMLMDVCELVGVKQVYYYALDLNSPLSLKSSGLQRLYADMRHPGAVSLTLMFLIHPHMTSSRLLLTLVMVLYLLSRFNMDKEDHSYLQQKLASKEDELNTIVASSYRQEEMSVRHVWSHAFHRQSIKRAQ